MMTCFPQQWKEEKHLLIKIKGIKKKISKLKAIQKNSSKKINLYQIITKSVKNMNSLPTAKCKRVPNDIELFKWHWILKQTEADSISQGY